MQLSEQLLIPRSAKAAKSCRSNAEAPPAGPGVVSSPPADPGGGIISPSAPADPSSSTSPVPKQCSMMINLATKHSTINCHRVDTGQSMRQAGPDGLKEARHAVQGGAVAATETKLLK